jgi:hypothetical protein
MFHNSKVSDYVCISISKDFKRNCRVFPTDVEQCLIQILSRIKMLHKSGFEKNFFFQNCFFLNQWIKSCDFYPAQILHTGSCLSVHRHKPVQALIIQLHFEMGSTVVGVLRSPREHGAHNIP